MVSRDSEGGRKEWIGGVQGIFYSNDAILYDTVMIDMCYSFAKTHRITT